MTVSIIQGGALEVLATLAPQSFQSAITSPPYWGLRDYGTTPQAWPATTFSPMPGLPPMEIEAWEGELGCEPTPEAYVAHIVDIFRGVYRVLRDDGTLWLNIGDSYASSWAVNRRSEIGNGSMKDGSRPFRPNRAVSGIKEKDLCGIPWRMAFALQADGWFLRQEIIWAKPNPMPESATDRCTKSHEQLFLLSKQHKNYVFDCGAIEEPAVSAGRIAWNNSGSVLGAYGRSREGLKVRKEVGEKRRKRSVWHCPVSVLKEAHFATFPPALVEPCLLAGTRPGDAVLDPFGGSGTVGLVAQTHGRDSTLIELNPEYAAIADRRLASIQPQLQFA